MVNENIMAQRALGILKTSCISFPNIFICFRKLLNMPVTSEKAFSKLKIIKNQLHSTIPQKRFSRLATISI